VEYYKKQLAELVIYLEDISHKKMDYQRLEQVVRHALELLELYRKIYQLRKASPAPMRNRTCMNQLIIEWTFCGTAEGVKFFQTVHDEVKENVDDHKGVVPEEKYRILSLFLPPFYEYKLLDWMEREYGATVAMDLMSSWPMPLDIDPSKPLEAVARLTFYRVGSRLMHGPAEDFIQDALLNARDFKVDGALFFAHIGCRQACALIKTIKDALWDELGIKTSVIDMDLMDPSFSSSDELKNKLEQFFEMLEEKA
jgi:benzoyl-CoA reductase/2-hydroxyglutaryl-CoA dehydratase subunit BcrC/BadD/HgdB